MARGVNKVILVGNLGADPDARYMPSGAAVTSISVATSEQWTDKATGQKQERTEWHRVTLFSRLGEVAAEYLRKGSQVYIEGSIRTDKYQDKQTGQDRYSTQIIASNMQLLGGGGGQGSSGGEFEGTASGGAGADGSRGASSGQPSRTSPDSGSDTSRSSGSRSAAKPAVATADGVADFDDDIPFMRSELERSC